MTKICGYSCHHNKGGICQITYCDKIGEITTTTTTTQWLSGGRQQGKTYQLIKDQQKEIERLNNIIDELENSWKEQQEHYRYIKDNRYRTFLSKNLDKLKELKGSK